jgi:rhodanese-related sulfurtransferase
MYEPSTTPWLLSTDLTTLPTDKTIVVYCYTGQTSAYVTSYLKTLGYDAKSLVFGANSMIHDVMAAAQNHAWGAGAIMDYEYDVVN